MSNFISGIKFNEENRKEVAEKFGSAIETKNHSTIAKKHHKHHKPHFRRIKPWKSNNFDKEIGKIIIIKLAFSSQPVGLSL